MSNHICLRASRLLGYITLAAVTVVHAPASRGQEADIKKQLQGVDLEGVKQLTLSHNGELAAGLTVVYRNHRAESLVKVWSIKEKQLVHEFRFRGKAHALAFSPDDSTLVTADASGNLATETKIRFWDLAQGKELKRFAFVGQIRELIFSPDGGRLAAAVGFNYFDSIANSQHRKIACIAQIRVWQVAGAGDVLINITHPCGEWVEVWPSNEKVKPWSGEQIQAALLNVYPKRLRFSPDGKTLTCETETGLRTVYDSQTGAMLQNPGMASVGLFNAMLMIALNQVPADVNSLTIEITPRKKTVRMERASDGWWRVGDDKQFGFKVNGEYFATLAKGVEKKDQIVMRLGLNDTTRLEDLSSFRHPLGVIKISRDETGLRFRHQEVTDGTSGKTLQAGEVRWTRTVEDE